MLEGDAENCLVISASSLAQKSWFSEESQVKIGLNLANLKRGTMSGQEGQGKCRMGLGKAKVSRKELKWMGQDTARARLRPCTLWTGINRSH
jgi:hypothetical protein